MVHILYSFYFKAWLENFAPGASA